MRRVQCPCLALTNKLARIACSVLARDLAVEARLAGKRTQAMADFLAGSFKLIYKDAPEEAPMKRIKGQQLIA